MPLNLSSRLSRMLWSSCWHAGGCQCVHGVIMLMISMLTNRELRSRACTTAPGTAACAPPWLCPAVPGCWPPEAWSTEPANVPSRRPAAGQHLRSLNVHHSWIKQVLCRDAAPNGQEVLMAQTTTEVSPVPYSCLYMAAESGDSSSMT